jgi:hypothetical protein
MSLSERKKQIITDIANSYSSQIIQTNQSSSVIATSFIISVQSKKIGDLCNKCMLTYLSQDDIDKIDFQNNSPSNIYLQLFKEIGTGVCGGLCYIKIEDIQQNNILVYDIQSTLNVQPIDVKKIIDYVKSEIQKRYGYTDTSNNFDQLITNIITMIKAKTEVNVTQNINSQQIIQATGGNLVGVTQNLVVDSVMNAIATSSDAVNLVDQMVQEQMDFIQKEVDKNVIGDFTYVWEESKAYIIGCGIFLLSLFIIIIVLLMYKAAN